MFKNIHNNLKQCVDSLTVSKRGAFNLFLTKNEVYTSRGITGLWRFD